MCRIYKDGGWWCKKLRKMKNLKCDYGSVQKESNETDADEGDTCMVPSVQVCLRY